MSDWYCTSCRKDMEDCHCGTTLSWKERAAAKRAREARQAKEQARQAKEQAS